MPNIKLFTTTNQVQEIPASAVTLESELQGLIERHMPIFFGVTFLQREYRTSNGGRIDSLGVDENGCPVIFEYKRSSNENVINQGLFYLDWLLDHKAEFELIVMNMLCKEKADKLDWSMPRLICVAGDFTLFDSYAVNQINRNIDLWRYARFGGDLLMLELLNAKTADPLSTPNSANPPKTASGHSYKTLEAQLSDTSSDIQNLYQSICSYILSLNDDITENKLKYYTAFKKIRNIACVEVYQKQVFIHLRLDPESLQIEDGFTRDVRQVGHFGTGDLRVILKNNADFEKAKPLIDLAYQLN